MSRAEEKSQQTRVSFRLCLESCFVGQCVYVSELIPATAWKNLVDRAVSKQMIAELGENWIADREPYEDHSFL